MRSTSIPIDVKGEVTLTHQKEDTWKIDWALESDSEEAMTLQALVIVKHYISSFLESEGDEFGQDEINMLTECMDTLETLTDGLCEAILDSETEN